ncbi:hypothetical protein ACFWIZ_33495, partial [Streptomyces sp. NPDC127044]
MSSSPTPADTDTDSATATATATATDSAPRTDGARDTGLHTITHIERIRLGPDRQLARRDSQHALRAHRD